TVDVVHTAAVQLQANIEHTTEMSHHLGRGDVTRAEMADIQKTGQDIKRWMSMAPGGSHAADFINTVVRREGIRVSLLKGEQTSRQEFTEKAQQLAPFSPHIARGQAQAQIAGILGNIEEAKILGPNLGGFTRDQAIYEAAARSAAAEYKKNEIDKLQKVL